MKYFIVEGPIDYITRRIVVEAESEDEAWNLWCNCTSSGKIIGDYTDSPHTSEFDLGDEFSDQTRTFEITKEQADEQKDHVMEKNIDELIDEKFAELMHDTTAMWTTLLGRAHELMEMDIHKPEELVAEVTLANQITDAWKDVQKKRKISITLKNRD